MSPLESSSLRGALHEELQYSFALQLEVLGKNIYVGGWGGESFETPPTRKSISVSGLCRACGRGEAAWAGVRRFDR